jgi:hypothetical protein
LDYVESEKSQARAAVSGWPDDGDGIPPHFYNGTDLIP